MEDIAKANSKTIGQVALNWLLSKDEHISPIPGAKNVRQASENAGSIGWRLTDEEFEQIDRASQPFS
jgi:aryl-alcohol dehydrogenase-like predicted oxidoreductase